MSTRVIRNTATTSGPLTTSNAPIILPAVGTAGANITTGTHAYGAYIVLGITPVRAAGFGLYMIAFTDISASVTDICFQLATGATGSEVPIGEFRPNTIANQADGAVITSPYPLLFIPGNTQINVRASSNGGFGVQCALTLLPL